MVGGLVESSSIPSFSISCSLPRLVRIVKVGVVDVDGMDECNIVGTDDADIVGVFVG